MIIIPAQLEGYRSLKDKTLKVTFETNELNPQDLMGLIENTGQFGYLAFKSDPFKAEEKEVLSNLESGYGEKGKSPSQRLRGVLYVNYTKNNEGFDTFTRYYDFQMEKITNHYKSKLD
jgi:hypothetical protein